MREEPEANFKKSPKKKNESAREERRKFFSSCSFNSLTNSLDRTLNDFNINEKKFYSLSNARVERMSNPVRNLRSKFWWFTLICDSHYLSHFTAFFIVNGTKTSTKSDNSFFFKLEKNQREANISRARQQDLFFLLFFFFCFFLVFSRLFCLCFSLLKKKKKKIFLLGVRRRRSVVRRRRRAVVVVSRNNRHSHTHARTQTHTNARTHRNAKT